MTCLLFWEYLGTHLNEKNFFRCMCFCNIKIFKNFFSFLVKVVCKTYFFHDLASSILNYLMSGFSSY